MKIVQANTQGEGVRAQISTIFVDGFYQWLRYFSGDKAKLAGAFCHAFNLDVFWLAISEDGTVLGMAAVGDGSAPTVRLDKAEFKKHLGFFMGGFAWRMLKKEFEEKPYPFPLTSGMGTVEFVATSARHRGQGVATGLLRGIFAATPYREYVLEVADTNTPAVTVYEKLGFAEFLRVPLGRAEAKQSDLNNYVYMKYTKLGVGIRKVTGNKKDHLDLLLLADEQESMIDKYLEKGEMFVLEDGGVKAECVVTKESDGVYELKNIAVLPGCQRKGYGKRLIEFLFAHYADCAVMYVGTGDSPSTLSFYMTCGFTESHRVKNFFTDHYDHPMFGDGKQLVDMVYLKRELNKN